MNNEKLFKEFLVSTEYRKMDLFIEQIMKVNVLKM